MTENTFLFIDGNRGIYVPVEFAKRMNGTDVPPEFEEDLDCIRKGPDEEGYWDSWANIVDNFKLKLADGSNGILYESDGDLFIVPENEIN
jgi:hypothetical protein